MAVKILEFLGMNAHELNPSDPRLANKFCPYMGKICKKIDRYGEQKPMCVVESTGGVPLIVCEHRLLSTDMQNPTHYQRSRLLEISKVIFEDSLEAQDIEYRYEVTTRLRQRADFILRDKRNGDACILEVQGGGETSSTRILTDHVTRWENGENVRLDDFPFRVTKNGKKATPGLIPANAWRHLQEQLIVKDGICVSSEKKFVAAMGKTIYLHLLGKLPLVESLKRQKMGSWNCAFIPYEIRKGETIGFALDADNVLYLDLKELINKLIEYGVKDDGFFNTFLQKVSTSHCMATVIPAISKPKSNPPIPEKNEATCKRLSTMLISIGLLLKHTQHVGCSQEYLSWNLDDNHTMETQGVSGARGNNSV